MESTEHNAIWGDDLLRRQHDADYIIRFISGMASQRRRLGRPASYVLNIDSPWGTGKTFFLDRFTKELELRGHLVAYINAWKDDRAEDPLIAIMAHIEEAIFPNGSLSRRRREAWRLTKQSAVQIAAKAGTGLITTALNRYIGHSFSELLDASAANGQDKLLTDEGIRKATNEIDDLLDQFSNSIIEDYKRQIKSVESFRRNLSRSIAKGKIEQDEKFLFILIDELDRCRPTYAISLLERVKHLFDVNNVVFVIATDNHQLQHSVRGSYGGEFDGRQYLKRFFDQSYTFPIPNWEQFLSAHIGIIDTEKVEHPDETLHQFFLSVADAWNPDFRTMLQWLEHCQTVIATWEYSEKIQLPLLISSIIRLHRDGDESFITGESESGVFIDKFKTWHTRGNVSYNSDSGINRPASIYGIHISFMRSLKNPFKYVSGPPPDNFESEYVFSSFRSEVLSRGRNNLNPSVQAKIPSLVRSAGQFTDLGPDPSST